MNSLQELAHICRSSWLLIIEACLQVLQLAQTSTVQGEEQAKMIEAMISMRVLQRVADRLEKVCNTHAQPLHRRGQHEIWRHDPYVHAGCMVTSVERVHLASQQPMGGARASVWCLASCLPSHRDMQHDTSVEHKSWPADVPVSQSFVNRLAQVADAYYPVSQHRFRWALYAMVVSVVQALGMACFHNAWLAVCCIQMHISLFRFTTIG